MMSLQIWLRIILVSAVLAVLAPLFSMSLSIPMIQLVIENEWFTADEILAMSPQEFQEKVEPHLMPADNIFEKWIFASTFPEFWPLYIKEAFSWFLGFLLATTLVSVWNEWKRDTSK